MNSCHVVVVPSSVRNLTAKANTPTEVIVSWRPPEHPNGPLTDIIYFIEWLTVNKDGSQSHDRVEVEGTWLGGVSGGTQVKNLKSSQWYHLKVRSCILDISPSILHPTAEN